MCEWRLPSTLLGQTVTSSRKDCWLLIWAKSSCSGFLVLFLLLQSLSLSISSPPTPSFSSFLLLCLLVSICWAPITQWTLDDGFLGLNVGNSWSQGFTSFFHNLRSKISKIFRDVCVCMWQYYQLWWFLISESSKYAKYNLAFCCKFWKKKPIWERAQLPLCLFVSILEAAGESHGEPSLHVLDLPSSCLT